MRFGTTRKIASISIENALTPVIADGFHGTAFHRFLAKFFLFGTRGLLINVGVAAVIIAAKIARSGLAAEITVDALVIDIVFAGDIFGIAVCDVSHNLLEGEAYTGREWVQ
jgi:uncharacterized membrane protein YedE/YeeE